MREIIETTLTMLLESEIRESFRDEQTYNYRQALEQAYNEANQLKTTTGHEKIINTLELFSYGNISMYETNPHPFLELDYQEKRKLTELSILSVLNRNVGNEIGLEYLLSTLVPEISTCDQLEAHLMRMVDLGAIMVKIDEMREVVLVEDTLRLRDAYNKDKYSLRVLSTEDIEDVSIQQAKINLKEWIDTKVVPTTRELSGLV